MTRLPLSVISGYLGAGKTTLINRLLAADHGLRLAVLVNDFGAINIDAALLQRASDDTIELTNGCVCCTMSGHLFYAIGDLLDRHPRPDHILVEASGIANPAKIATLALAEPEMTYGGILTVVDAVNFTAQIADPRIAGQVRDQVRAGDFIAISKSARANSPVADALHECGAPSWINADDTASIQALLFAGATQNPPSPDTETAHPAYAQWSTQSPRALTRSELDQLLSHRPAGIQRLKGLIPDGAGSAWEVHIVGQQTGISRVPHQRRTGLVAIGLAGAFSAAEMDAWWFGQS
ncbi:MAG: GTP-binding protein [Pseudomonadota bacterium]